MTARACIAKGTTKNPELLKWMKELHLYSVLYNFDIEAVWLPGSCNVIPDAISRFRSPNLRGWFLSLLDIPRRDSVSMYCSMCCHR